MTPCDDISARDTLYLQALKRYYDYDSFRSIQLDIIRSIGSGHDTLGLMPTGGGKSITFQIPALVMEGVCIVITPLISLMKDQVTHLKARGIHAEAIYSGISYQEIQKILDNAIYGAVKFLYISPERLANKLFLAKLYYMKVCFITVDEAHCISQWGYDFRPPYLRINEIRERVPDAPVLALTATATPLVVGDIQERLMFGKYSELTPAVFQMSFKRENLSYVVRKTEDKMREMVHILSSVGGSTIIYTRNREKTKTLAKELVEQGFSATFYHAGLDIAVKDKRQEQWHNNEFRVMVATNAFGMGIDKPDVRLVIHADCPDSLEEYFQEAGRAGRDGKRAYAVLLYNGNDRKQLMKRCAIAFPPKDYIRRVYDHLAYFFELAVETGEGARYEFDEHLFCYRFKHYPTHLEAALSILQNAGYIHYESDPDTSPRVMIITSREALYHIENMSRNEDAVLDTLLRHYGSLFADLTYIREGEVAAKNGITTDELHVTLKELAQKRIIRYVPRRNTPIITFIQQRIDSERLRFSKDIYETLQERLMERVNHFLQYAESDARCRQNLLMEYFGEKGAKPCGCCDVCLAENSKGTEETKEKNASALEIVMNMLSDNKPHYISELRTLGITESELHYVIEQIRNNDNISTDGVFIQLFRD